MTGAVPPLSPLAAELAPDVLDRFLRYVQVATESQDGVDASPSTRKQFDLARILERELHALGLAEVTLDEHCHVYATVPATTARPAPVLGLVAHVDTYPDEIGTGVRPLVHRNWDGADLPLAGEPAQVLRLADLPQLAAHVGHDLVTSDGTTLLGADDKAGVAEIMAAAAYLVRHPELEHGVVKVAFTPDEEIGRGVEHFDLAGFGADLAFTADGAAVGELTTENFNASSVTVAFTGLEAHPGTARGAMVNSLKLAADFVAALPRDTLTPETTEGYEGFVHPVRVAGTTAATTVTLIARDFSEDGLEQSCALLRELAARTVQAAPGSSVEVTVTPSYRNMAPFLEGRDWLVDAAEAAIRRAGLEPVRKPVRGGTDGAMLTEKGLPTPNLGTGTGGHHSRREWACVQCMGTAASILVHLAAVVAGTEPEA